MLIPLRCWKYEYASMRIAILDREEKALSDFSAINSVLKRKSNSSLNKHKQYDEQSSHVDPFRTDYDLNHCIAAVKDLCFLVGWRRTSKKVQNYESEIYLEVRLFNRVYWLKKCWLSTTSYVLYFQDRKQNLIPLAIVTVNLIPYHFSTSYDDRYIEEFQC